MAKYVIGTGWWCDNNAAQYKTNGDEEIRGVDFHKKWYRSIVENTDPQKIIIVDSNSPVKPALDETSHIIEFVSLNINSGHSTNLFSGRKYCGWTSSVILSLQYANSCDCDYMVYVEQDVLLKGKGIIEEAINNMEASKLNYAFGAPGSTPQPLQQSFFVIKRDYIDTFLSRFMSIKSSDSRISPETKFLMSVKPWSNYIPEVFFTNRYFNYIIKKLSHVDFLPYGYGRDRPIDHKSKYYYFQHGSSSELRDYEQS